MFTTKCFIRKNTPELRNKLENLGYHICSCCKFKDNIWLHNLISDKHDRYEIHGLGAWDVEDNQEEVLNLYLIGNAEHPNPAIDCGENEELFLALAALRDDTDKYQWFIYNSMDCTVEKLRNFYWFKCEEDKIEDMMYWDCAYLNCTKATVEELIEHFK
jgi:hypothetical protein